MTPVRIAASLTIIVDSAAVNVINTAPTVTVAGATDIVDSGLVPLTTTVGTTEGVTDCIIDSAGEANTVAVAVTPAFGTVQVLLAADALNTPACVNTAEGTENSDCGAVAAITTAVAIAGSLAARVEDAAEADTWTLGEAVTASIVELTGVAATRTVAVTVGVIDSNVD